MFDKLKKTDWIQIGILTIAIVSLWTSTTMTSKQSQSDIEARFARIEQRMDDADQWHKEVIDTLNRIETKADRIR